jgi:hypothetical protein
MKGKLWELGPFLFAAAVALYLLAARLAAPPPNGEGLSRTAIPRASSGPGDPTKPEDFMPDAHSEPDPNAGPDPKLSTATAGYGARRP